MVSLTDLILFAFASVGLANVISAIWARYKFKTRAEYLKHRIERDERELETIGKKRKSLY